MRNPWLSIPLEDYEAHMALPAVGQAKMLADHLATTLRDYRPESFAIIGCAGGNGFDRIPTGMASRVIGVDINPAYIEAATTRYGGRIAGLDLHVADIQAGPPGFEPVDLVYVGLVFEYVSLTETLKNLKKICKPGGHLIAVLQQPGKEPVTPSPYKSLEALAPVMHLVRPGELSDAAATFGFALEAERTTTLKSGKSFTFQTYRRTPRKSSRR